MDSATGAQGWPGARHKSFPRTFLSQCFDQSMFPKGNIGNPVPPTFAGPAGSAAGDFVDWWSASRGALTTTENASQVPIYVAKTQHPPVPSTIARAIHYRRCHPLLPVRRIGGW